MIPQTVPPHLASPAWCDEIAVFAAKWGITFELASKLSTLAGRVPFRVRIISGFRDEKKQEELLAKPDSTAAPVGRSTHTSRDPNGCPAATGADIEPEIAVTDHVKRLMGDAGLLVGLRWGGGAPLDPTTKIPVGVEWRHFDLGPR